MTAVEEIISKSKENLSKKSLDLFLCLMHKLKNIDEDEVDIQIEAHKDFARVSLTSKHNDRISFFVDIFSGYCDFIIDNGKEVFIQREFKSVKEADDYFEEFLESPIKYVKAEKEKGKIRKEEYILMSHKGNVTLSGKIGFVFKNASKLIKSERGFIPWIKK